MTTKKLLKRLAEEVPTNPIDTSGLRGNDYCFVVGYLISSIITNGKATREDAEKAIGAAIAHRARTES